MFIYGSRPTLIGAEPITNTCEHCNTSGSMTMNIQQRYFHIFWIPIIPFNKIGYTQCSHCKKVIESDEMSPELKEVFKSIKKTKRIPIWTFFGIFAVISLISYSFIIREIEHNKDKVFIDSPKIGDIYEYKVNTSDYTLLKVIKVDDNDIFVSQNTQVVTKFRELRKLEESATGSYESNTRSISRSELLNMFEMRDIMDVVRK